mmetsp:Transcript_115569/g.222709  ORF Transcript_115569/g.222709 Transcript_115569/m.222709 type:complete len:99 (+) Transcript_115569:253-549(+)
MCNKLCGCKALEYLDFNELEAFNLQSSSPPGARAVLHFCFRDLNLRLWHKLSRIPDSQCIVCVRMLHPRSCALECMPCLCQKDVPFPYCNIRFQGRRN